MEKSKALKKPQGLADQLGALLYYDQVKGDGKAERPQFESLPEKEQALYTIQAIKFIGFLDKLNLTLSPKPNLKKQQATEAQNLEILEDIIKNFVNGLKTTKPGLFPCRELAARILAGEK